MRVLFFLGLFSFSAFSQSFLPANPWQISSKVLDSGISEAAFKKIVDEALKLYSPIFWAKGKELVIYKAWSSSTVNAYADRSDDGRQWEVILYGGLARHPQMTEDAFRLVVCHEMGHHLAGAPKKNSNTWSSVEGQSDYFAPLKCLKKWWKKEDLSSWRAATIVPQIVETKCEQAYDLFSEQLICMRSSLAGKAVAMVMKEIEWESLEPMFDTPDSKVVATTLLGHPTPQCRLDTYFQAALCSIDDRLEHDDENPQVGVCPQTASVGFRPLCWFHPRFF